MEERQDLISRQAAIDTEGLDEEIRCEMCRNPMHTDRGCDGHCKYDEKLYERIMKILDKRIKPLPSAQTDIKPISYQDCANAMMMMWIDNVLTDGEYRRIMDKLNDHESRKENRCLKCLMDKTRIV